LIKHPVTDTVTIGILPDFKLGKVGITGIEPPVGVCVIKQH